MMMMMMMDGTGWQAPHGRRDVPRMMHAAGCTDKDGRCKTGISHGAPIQYRRAQLCTRRLVGHARCFVQWLSRGVFVFIWGSVCDHLGVILGSFWGHLWFILGSFGVILGSFWHHVEIIWGSFWSHLELFCDHSEVIWGSFWDHFGIIP